MLVSVSTGKSRSAWLDRLRTARGFPQNGVTDLEDFLRNPNSPNHEGLESKPSPGPISGPTQNEDRQLFSIMSDVLNELFNFGDKCSNSTKLKKSARKQTNPRICVCSNNWSNENNNAASEKVTLVRSGDSNSGVEGVKVLDKLENEGEGVEKDGNWAGFSRTEVTVIDTSYELWKFEKLLYRKKNVWKVRDKKGKSSTVESKKKRRVSGDLDEGQHGGKKWKVDRSEGNAEESEFPVNEINKSEVHEKAPDKVGRTMRKKPRDFSCLPRNFENGSSSVILIKSIHTGKKNGTSLSKCSLKSKQKKT